MHSALTIPLDVGRDEARDLAGDELARPRYAEDPSSWFRQALEWIGQRIIDLIDLVDSGGLGMVVIAVVVGILVAGIVLAVRRSRPDARRASGAVSAIFGDRRLTATQFRAAADAAAHAGDWNTAVVERFRAVAAELEERGVVEPRAGRTADELAGEGSAAIPSLRSDLQASTAIFDAVRYGGGQAQPSDDRRLADIDDVVRTGRRSRTDRASVGSPR